MAFLFLAVPSGRWLEVFYTAHRLYLLTLIVANAFKDSSTNGKQFSLVQAVAFTYDLTLTNATFYFLACFIVRSVVFFPSD